jgi:hypothetical protein
MEPIMVTVMPKSMSPRQAAEKRRRCCFLSIDVADRSDESAGSFDPIYSPDSRSSTAVSSKFLSFLIKSYKPYYDPALRKTPV